MASSSDVKLQLIIEAINRSETQLNKLRSDLAAVEAAGNAGTASMQGMGPAIARARDHVAAAQKELPGFAEKFAAIGAAGTTAGVELEKAGDKGAQAMDRVHDHASRSHSMLGQMVQMALVFGSIAFAEKLASSGIEYNKALETSKLGISAIMTSMGVITDQQGRVVQGQEKWNAATRLSVEAQRELERIGMTTPATYEELVQAYQALEAPMLGAKLSFQESLELTGLITNSVKAMGLPMQQIVQEGRDLVAGTIDQNSQLAKSLGITNEDVKKWREKGTVFQEITQRLEGFKYTQAEMANTWDGAWSNFKDVAQRALGEGSLPLFDFIKKEMIRLSNDMVTITRDASGKIVDIQVKPEVVARIRELAEDLKKLTQLLEAAVKWGGKLAEPALLVGIAVGITKITAAVKELAVAANAGSLARLISSLPALAAVAGMWAGKQYADAKSLSDDAANIRRSALANRDHDSMRLKNSGVDTMANLDQFGWRELAAVRQKLPAADDAQIAAMLRRGIINLQKESVPGFDKEYRYSLNIDDGAAKKFLDGEKSPYDVKGNNRKTPEQIKKENAEARAAIERRYQEEIGTVKEGEAAKIEALKSAQKSQEELYQSGAISEAAFLRSKYESEQEILVTGINAAIDEQNALLDEWAAKSKHFRPEDKKERDEAERDFDKKWSALEVEINKKEGELSRAGADERISQIKRVREAETARREGALKLLQEELAGERQLTQLLLEREKITPFEAEKRNIGNEQAGMEADYWNTFARKKQGGLSRAQILELDSQLAVLEQKMANLEQAAPDRLYKASRSSDALEAKRAEARISHELAELDERQKLREIGKADALKRQVQLSGELLDSQLKVQRAIDPSDTTAWNTQQAAIDATRQKLLELKLELRNYSDDLAGGFREGIEQYLDSLGGPFQKMAELSRSTAQAMQQGFSDLFFDVMTGKIDDLGKALESMLNSIQRAIANTMAQMASEGLLSGIKSWIAPAAGAAAGSGSGGMGGVDTAAIAHQGGLILHEGGMVVPRFHLGGLASDEVPAVLLKRERVLSIEQNQLFEKFVKKTEGPGGVSVAVNVQNQSSQPVSAKAAPRFDGKRAIIDIVLEDIYSGGDLYQAIGGKH